MSEELKVNQSVVRLIREDITDLEVESFVFYASENLELGSGFGNAISMRGGPSIQKELKELAPCKLTEAVVTEAGNMKAKYIVHAVGPKFQEEDTNRKLAQTVQSALHCAAEKGIKQIALPAMGAGFYGVPLPDCARETLSSVKAFLDTNDGIGEVIICLNDSREHGAFRTQLSSMS